MEYGGMGDGPLLGPVQPYERKTLNFRRRIGRVTAQLSDSNYQLVQSQLPALVLRNPLPAGLDFLRTNH